MPEIKIKHVASFSSEDKVHKAENILKAETYRKWKCATPGEKNASIVLQFEKATKIHSIDIGNESSAFVEVLVGRSSNSVNEYQVLLVASSFMSPLESRNENHTNRVRMFENEKLAQNLKEEKWDCVQVVCTQPFNKNITYGLSFIKFHSPPEKHFELPPESETKTATTKLGAFEMKYEDDDDIESSPPVGSSWLKNKDSTSAYKIPKISSQESPSYAATVLASSSQSKPERSGLSEYEKMVQKNKEESQKLIKALKIQEAKKDLASAVKDLKARSDTEVKRSPSQQMPLKDTNKRMDSPKVNTLKRAADLNDDRPSKKRELQNTNDKASSSNHSNKVANVEKKKPFNKIMDKVVFALSGFVNPLRGELRDKALEMGAKYKGDWDRSCTHLVCAFVNTPKYLQVRKEDGKIVSKEWITECYKKKVSLPWRSYMLGKYSKSSSEEESESDHEKTVPKVKAGSTKANGNHSKDQSTAKKRKAWIVSDSDSEDETPAPANQQRSKPKSLFGDSDLNGEEATNQSPGPSKTVKEDSETEDEEALQDYMAATDVELDSGGDTEDEIRKVYEQAEKRKRAARTERNVSSEEEDSSSLLDASKPDTSDLPLPELPNLFKKRHFYLYGEFSSHKRHDLQRYITAYNGIIEDYMGESVKYVVTEKGWDKNFEEALEENEDLIFVKPEWIFKCHVDEKLVPYQAYIVIPS